MKTAVGERFLGYLAKGARLLDVGCGSGRDMAWMEAQGFRTVGIDLSSGMLAQARKLARGEVRHMDMCHLTFPDTSFEGSLVSRFFVAYPTRPGSRCFGSDAPCPGPRRHAVSESASKVPRTHCLLGSRFIS